MSNFGLSCDVCGKEVQGYTLANGMKFCAKCYQETFGDKNMTENLNNMYEAYLKILNEKDQRIAELEEQLAEKDREIELLNAMINTIPAHDNELKKIYNEDKISFAIEQLEEVKEHISGGIAFDEDVQMWFEKYIDDQIEQLKEGA